MKPTFKLWTGRGMIEVDGKVATELHTKIEATISGAPPGTYFGITIDPGDGGNPVELPFRYGRSFEADFGGALVVDGDVVGDLTGRLK